MTMESSIAVAAGGSNDGDTIAPNVDERPKAGGAATDSASQAVADEENGRDAMARRPGAHEIAGIGAADTAHCVAQQPQGPTMNNGASHRPELDGTHVEAFPVVDEQYTSVVGEPIKPFHQRREGRVVLMVISVLLVSLAVILAVFLGANGKEESDNIEAAITTSEPTMKPTYDPRSTLEIVRERGYLNCGVDGSIDWGGAVNFGAYAADFCRIVASVALGNPDKVNYTSVSGDQFIKLQERLVDVLFAGYVLTLDKAVKEPTTGLKFLFGTPYYHSSIVYLGEQEYIRCASDGKRYGVCEDLAVCAVDTTEIRNLIPTILPAPFVTFGLFPEMSEALQNETCNVLVSGSYKIYGDSKLQDKIFSGSYIMSSFHISRDPLVSVIRPGDYAWFDLVEGAKAAALRSSHRNIEVAIGPWTCPNSTELPMSFLNAPRCVGSTYEVFERSLGPNAYGYNNSFMPTIDAYNFGSLDCEGECDDALKYGTLKRIKERGQLNCGVYIPPHLTSKSLQTVISTKYCFLVAVAIFQGDPSAANVTYLGSEDFSVDFLPDFPADFDVVAGVNWEDYVSLDSEISEERLGKATATSFYYWQDKFEYNGTLYDGVGKGPSLFTHVADSTFSTFTEYVTASVVYAQRNKITKNSNQNMPLAHIFGSGLTFMLRDVVSYAGNYDEILEEAISLSDQAVGQGWNAVRQNIDLYAGLPVYNCDAYGTCAPCQNLDFDGVEVCLSIGFA